MCSMLCSRLGVKSLFSFMFPLRLKNVFSGVLQNKSEECILCCVSDWE